MLKKQEARIPKRAGAVSCIKRIPLRRPNASKELLQIFLGSKSEFSLTPSQICLSRFVLLVSQPGGDATPKCLS